MNPFKYGNPVSGDFFVERKALKGSVSSFLTNQINIVLIGPRRFGKTSFILNLFKDLEANGFQTLYVDTFNVVSHRDFLQQLINAMSKKKGWVKKIKDWVGTLPKHFQPTLAFDGSTPTFSLATQQSSYEDVKQLIVSSLETLSDLSEKVCIAFDEFQAVGDLEDDGWLEATIRSKMQFMKNVSFLFSGSRHGMLHDMFNSPTRPFYRSCQLIDFPPMGPEFTDWILHRFSKIGISCDHETINYLRSLVDDTPNYVQMACFHIVAHEYKLVDHEIVDKILDSITSQNAYPYQTILNSLTLVHRRVLRMAACEGKAIYSKDILEKYEIKTGAHVAQAINSLVTKQILDSNTGSGKVVFDDPLFPIWLRKQFII